MDEKKELFVGKIEDLLKKTSLSRKDKDTVLTWSTFLSCEVGEDMLEQLFELCNQKRFFFGYVFCIIIDKDKDMTAAARAYLKTSHLSSDAEFDMLRINRVGGLIELWTTVYFDNSLDTRKIRAEKFLFQDDRLRGTRSMLIDFMASCCLGGDKLGDDVYIRSTDFYGIAERAFKASAGAAFSAPFRTWFGAGLGANALFETVASSKLFRGFHVPGNVISFSEFVDQFKLIDERERTDLKKPVLAIGMIQWTGIRASHLMAFGHDYDNGAASGKCQIDFAYSELDTDYFKKLFRVYFKRDITALTTEKRVDSFHKYFIASADGEDRVSKRSAVTKKLINHLS